MDDRYHCVVLCIIFVTDFTVMRVKYYSKFLFFLLFNILLAYEVAYAEGTKEIMPNSGNEAHIMPANGIFGGNQRDPFALEGGPADYRLNIHISDYTTEVIHFGLGTSNNPIAINWRIRAPDGTEAWLGTTPTASSPTGYISTYAQAVAGPQILNATGYPSNSCTPTMNGDYYMTFQLNNNSGREFDYFDITVVNTTTMTKIDGRVFSKCWQIRNPSSGFGQYYTFEGLMYIYSIDGIVTRFDPNNFEGRDFSFSCNESGCYAVPPSTTQLARQSQPGPNPHNYPQYKIFLNDPDHTAYPDGAIGQLIADSLFTESKCNSGTIDFIFKTTGPGSGSVMLLLNTLGAPYADRELTQSVTGGWDTITWDGKDANGLQVPSGSSFPFTMSFTNGLTHLPLWDVEENVNGFKVNLIRPITVPPLPDPAFYWDDILVNGITSTTPPGCSVPPATGCHIWDNDWGDQKTINTWWFLVSNSTAQVTITYKKSPANLGSITGVNSVCQGALGIAFSVVPDPSSTSYTWSYSGTGVTINGTGSSVTLNFAVNATSGTLSVQGWNPDCGVGPTSTKSITVDPLPDPAGVISGTANVCLTQTYTYSVPAIANAASYSWSYSGTGATILPPGNTNSVQIQFSPAATPGQLSVMGVNSCGSGTPSLFPITVAPFPGAAGAISGPSPVCQTETGIIYSVPPIANATSYSWSLPPGVSGTSSINTITVNFSQTAATGNITVNGINSCGDGTSNSRSITVNPRAYPAGPITGPPGICQGSSATYTIDPITNAVSYVWSYSGSGVTLTPSGTSATIDFSGSATSGVLSVAGANGICSNGDPSALNIAVGYQTPSALTICNNLTTMQGKPFALTGGTPLGGVYSGPGIAGSTFSPATAGIGNHTITYTFTNAPFGCSSSATATITVVASPPFVCGGMLTDIREPGKQYVTVQIGSQCWMAQNLDAGSRIADNKMQKDNCILEKFCYANMDANCGSFGGLYQWDELMSYTRLEEFQGICPPGWHIPSEDDWNTLFNFLGDVSTAGSAMKASGFSGFNAEMQGALFQNISPAFLNDATLFWTSTESGNDHALAHGLHVQTPSVSSKPTLKSNALAVRCVRD
ncbi:MAG: hypothetical protein FJY10_04435 [Bacteroidetes bacterium]|nr:hypothetical protein [Bacteroidota bacterium]